MHRSSAVKSVKCNYSSKIEKHTSTIYTSPFISASRLSSNRVRHVRPRPRFYFTSCQISVRRPSVPAWASLSLSLSLRCNLSVVSHVVPSFLPPFLPAHFAAFCSLYSLTPAVANSTPRSLPPLKNNTLHWSETSFTCSGFKTLGLQFASACEGFLLRKGNRKQI